MSDDQFEVKACDLKRIDVRHIPSGTRFSFAIEERQLLSKNLAVQRVVASGEDTKSEGLGLSGFALSYAEREARARDLID